MFLRTFSSWTSNRNQNDESKIRVGWYFHHNYIRSFDFYSVVFLLALFSYQFRLSKIERSSIKTNSSFFLPKQIFLPLVFVSVQSLGNMTIATRMSLLLRTGVK